MPLVTQGSRSAHRACCAAGISLVEMLVVLAMLMLMIALLMPALAKAREAARSAICKSNLGQLGNMTHVYAINHRNWLPWGSESSSIRWWTRLAVYSADRPKHTGGVWTCPTTADNSWLGYGWNYHGLGHSPSDPRLGPTRIDRGKGDCVLLADIGYAWNPATWPGTAIDMIPPVTGGAPPSQAHDKGLHSLNVDGNVAHFPANTWYFQTRWY